MLAGMTAVSVLPSITLTVSDQLLSSWVYEAETPKRRGSGSSPHTEAKAAAKDEKTQVSKSLLAAFGGCLYTRLCNEAVSWGPDWHVLIDLLVGFRGSRAVDADNGHDRRSANGSAERGGCVQSARPI